jgi:hypothetical protein
VRKFVNPVLTTASEDDALAATKAAVRTTEDAFSIVLRDPTLVQRGRALVLRARVDGLGETGNVIVKVFALAHRGHFLREKTGLRVLSGVRAVREWVPRLLADHDGAMAILMDEVPERASLPLLLGSRDSSGAVRTLIEVAKRLGALHGHARDSVARFRVAVPESLLPGRQLCAAIPTILAFYTQATDGGSAQPDVLTSALAELGRRVDKRGSLSTVTLGDMAPSNILLGPMGPVFVDLEYAEVRHAFYDAMFWRCICPFPTATADSMDVAYREGLREGGIDLDDEDFRRERFLLASHRIFWMLSWNGKRLLEGDREFVPGVGARSMLRRYLDDYVRLAAPDESTGAPVLIRSAQRLTDALARLWPESQPQGEFPCFAGDQA